MSDDALNSLYGYSKTELETRRQQWEKVSNNFYKNQQKSLEERIADSTKTIDEMHPNHPTKQQQPTYEYQTPQYVDTLRLNRFVGCSASDLISFIAYKPEDPAAKVISDEINYRVDTAIQALEKDGIIVNKEDIQSRLKLEALSSIRSELSNGEFIIYDRSTKVETYEYTPPAQPDKLDVLYQNIAKQIADIEQKLKEAKKKP